MAVLVIAEWPAGARHTRAYDAVGRHLGIDADPPAGLITHTAAMTDAGFRVIDVWESEEAWEAFRVDRLGPAVAAMLRDLPPEAAAEDGPPVIGVHPVHDLVVRAAAVASR